MFVVLQHTNGKTYKIPSSQIIACSDDGTPCSVTYQNSGLIIHVDASHKDFEATLISLGITKVTPPIQL